MPIKTIRADSLGDAFEKTIKFLSAWTRDGDPYCWFRGVKDKSLDLRPGAYWRKNYDEVGPLVMFAQEGVAFAEIEKMNCWKTYYLAQHSQIPTRLLDWTDSLHTALFFAVMGSLTWKIEHPCVWIINPFRLNQRSTNANVIYDRDDKLHLDYYESAKSQRWPFDLPVAMAAPWRNSRVYAQHGYFTLHGNDLRAIEECAPDCVKRVDIPQHLVREIIHILSHSSTNSFTLFPDLNGLALNLRRRFKLF